MSTPSLASRRLPAQFHLWWVVSTISAAGDSMLAFALIWTATSNGPAAVAIVSTLAVVPRILLMLFGGALGDRHGPRRLLIATTAIQFAALAVLAGLSIVSSGVVFLAAAAGATAVISAFQQPAAVVLPRLLITHEDQFARALARISGSLHAARILGVGVGGLAITALPLITIFGANAAVVGLSLVVLCSIHPRSDRRRAPATTSGASIWAALATGIKSVHELRIWPLLAAVALVCAAVLPTVAVVMPSMARSHGWTAAQAGLLEAGWATGTLVVTLLISYTGTIPKQVVPMVGGPALICAALAAMALPVSVPAAIALSALTGVGTAIFTTHIAPALLRMAPPDQLTRFQSLMAIVQLAPPALLNSPLAALSGTGRGSVALIITAGMAGAAAVAAAHGLHQKKSAAIPEERTAAQA
ncbi:MFS transporter [Brachybacterium tyrofermentans]|uniref:MFS transporter n=1 Tax=Brachybacterium tyrofermentans TaxID=47848 RepID=UPI003FCF5377